MHGPILLICGPQGSGKSYLTNLLLSTGRYGEPLKTTTRPMRPGEVNGVAYEFLSHEEYEAAAGEGAFFMDNKIQGYRYAIRRSVLEEVWNEEKICVLQIFYTVMYQFIGAYPGSVAIYLKPTPEILERRLKERCGDDEAAFLEQLGNAKRELVSIGQFIHFYRAVIPIGDDDTQPLLDLIETAMASNEIEIPQR